MRVGVDECEKAEEDDHHHAEDDDHHHAGPSNDPRYAVR